MHFICNFIFENGTLDFSSLFIFDKINKLCFVKDISRHPLLGHMTITLCRSQQRRHNHPSIIKRPILIDNTSRKLITDIREELMQLWLVHKGGEVELNGIFRCIVMINEVVYYWSYIVVHGFEDIGGRYDKGDFLSEILSVFYHVTAFVDGLLDEVEFL